MAAKGERRWLRQGRNKNDFKNDLPALIFVAGTIQAEFNASPMAFNIGQASPQVVVRLRPIVTSIFDAYDRLTSPGRKQIVSIRVRIGARSSLTRDERRNGVSTYLVSAKCI